MRVVNVIHDATNDARFESLEAQVKRQGMEISLWPAINGDIAEAHKQIVRYAKKRKWEDVIIMEDDIFFHSEHGFDYFMAKIPKTYDLYLAGVYNHFETLPNPDSLLKRFTGLHLYMVHSRFYELFLSVDCSKESLDNALSKLGEKGMGKFVCCYPFAAVQSEELPSTNLIGVFYRHKNYFNKENTYGFAEYEAAPGLRDRPNLG